MPHYNQQIQARSILIARGLDHIDISDALNAAYDEEYECQVSDLIARGEKIDNAARAQDSLLGMAIREGPDRSWTWWTRCLNFMSISGHELVCPSGPMAPYIAQ